MENKKVCGYCELYAHCLQYGKEINGDTQSCEDWEISVAELLDMIEKGDLTEEEIAEYMK